MNTFRNTLKSNYTLVPNEVAENPNLSWKAKGLFLLLASKPDDWDFYMEQISSYASDKMSALKSGVKELEENGYLIRKTKYSGDGKFNGLEWTLVLPEDTISRQTENPPDGKHARRETILHTNTNNTKTDNTNTNNTNYSLREKTDWFIDFWNKLYDTNVRFTENKQRQVGQRLKVFDANEIVQALKNRSNDTWLENNGYMKDWDSFWRNNEKVERYLNKQTDNLPF